MNRRQLLIAAAAGAAGVALAGGAVWYVANAGLDRRVTHAGVAYRVVKLEPKQRPLDLFWKGSDGRPLRTFGGLEAHAKRSGLKVLFATNAGIFDPSLTPLGLHVEHDRVLRPLNLAGGNGNFYLKPNGVFYIRNGEAKVYVSGLYDAARNTRTAVQSGPLLLEGKTPHPAILASSTDRHVRSGVGVTLDGLVCVALSESPVTFYELATFFRDALKCENVLHLDSNISQFHPGASEPNREYAAFLAVTAPS